VQIRALTYRYLDEANAEAMLPLDRRLHALVLQHAAVDELVQALVEARHAAFDEGLAVRLYLAPARDARRLHLLRRDVHAFSLSAFLQPMEVRCVTVTRAV
jgi:hypothetical protein